MATFDANTGGSDYGNSALRLTLGSSDLSARDYFTPADHPSLNAQDKDMGTGALMLLADADRPHTSPGHDHR